MAKGDIVRSSARCRCRCRCRSADLAERDVAATGLNQLWVVDLTYVRTAAGWIYPCSCSMSSLAWSLAIGGGTPGKAPPATSSTPSSVGLVARRFGFHTAQGHDFVRIVAGAHCLLSMRGTSGRTVASRAGQIDVYLACRVRAKGDNFGPSRCASKLSCSPGATFASMPSRNGAPDAFDPALDEDEFEAAEPAAA